MSNTANPNKKTWLSLSLIWCGIVDAFQTAAIAAHNDYKLKNLVETFQLSDGLV